jgi:hypothetical protein
MKGATQVRRRRRDRERNLPLFGTTIITEPIIDSDALATPSRDTDAASSGRSATTPESPSDEPTAEPMVQRSRNPGWLSVTD